MHTLTELKKLMHQYHFRPRKLFGQNFLVDKNITEKIVAHIAPTAEDTIVEIGPGFGALTSLLARHARVVYAIEKDRDLCVALKEQFSGQKNLHIVEGDILDVDITRFVSLEQKLKVVGNLPYYVTSPLLEKLIACRDIIEALFFTVQKEVGVRIVAVPGSKDFSSLTCFIQLFAIPSILFSLGPSVFYPRPGVSSVFIKILPQLHVRYPVSDEDFFLAVVHAGFSQRRKTMVNTLSAAGIVSLSKESLVDFLETHGFDSTARMETLSVERIAALSEVLLPYRRHLP